MTKARYLISLALSLEEWEEMKKIMAKGIKQIAIFRSGLKSFQEQK